MPSPVMRAAQCRPGASSAARPFQVLRRVDAERPVFHARAADPHARLQRAQLFQTSRAAPAARAAAPRSAPARRGGRRRCRHGASAARRPKGSAAREKYNAGATARPSANAQAAFTNDAVFASASDAIGSTRVPMSHAGSANGVDHRAQLCRGDRGNVALQIDHHVVPPVRIQLGQRRDARGPSRTANRDRSAPRGRRRRAPRRRSPRSPHATATGPRSASRPRSSTCTIIGLPWISASGLPGSRVEAMRAGMTTIGFTGGGLMGNGRFPMVRAPYGGERPRATACRRVRLRVSTPVRRGSHAAWTVWKSTRALPRSWSPALSSFSPA